MRNLAYLLWFYLNYEIAYLIHLIYSHTHTPVPAEPNKTVFLTNEKERSKRTTQIILDEITHFVTKTENEDEKTSKLYRGKCIHLFVDYDTSFNTRDRIEKYYSLV